MVKAYIFITTLGAHQIVENLKKIEGVKESFNIIGTYDLLIIVEAPSTSKLNQIITDAVRQVDGIQKTMTMVALN